MTYGLPQIWAAHSVASETVVNVRVAKVCVPI
jgi:hypothetical protein